MQTVSVDHYPNRDILSMSDKIIHIGQSDSGPKSNYYTFENLPALRLDRLVENSKSKNVVFVLSGTDDAIQGFLQNPQLMDILPNQKIYILLDTETENYTTQHDVVRKGFSEIGVEVETINK